MFRQFLSDILGDETPPRSVNASPPPAI
jgi:hypothetical protein